MHILYNVPIIPQNLRREETIIQIADALRYLSKVVDDIFDSVNKRISKNSTELLNLTSRIDAANAKISNLKGTKKATQVFSSCKYPAVDIYRDYKSIFENKPIEFTRTKVKYKEVPIKDKPLEPLQFYHVKLGPDKDEKSNSGLGEVPKDVQCVNDLLLYNTGKNPYKNYVLSDPLQSSFTIKKDDVMNISDIGEAPLSISDKTILTRSSVDSYFYSPDLGDVPVIDVPLDLPDLPGIADDLRYIDELGPGIAPSVATSPNVSEYPSTNESVTVSNTSMEIVDISIPLPPLFQNEVSATVTSEDVSSSAPVELNIIEPVVESKPVKNEPESSTSHPLMNMDDAHGSLMEAIRKAGGLKNAKLKAAEQKKSVPTGDLMADLHAKLSLRRKGISGFKSQDQDTSSAMNKISAMIPPPPINVEQTESTNTEDEDWD